MKKENLLITTGLSLVIAIFVCLANVHLSSAQECRLVRITATSASEAVFIEPETARISMGTCVVWLDLVPDQYEVQVKFNDAKECLDTTGSPQGYHVDEGCYLTNYMRKGMTSSLTFTKPGTYEYVVQVKNGAQSKGKIVVSQMMTK